MKKITREEILNIYEYEKTRAYKKLAVCILHPQKGIFHPAYFLTEKLYSFLFRA